MTNPVHFKNVHKYVCNSCDCHMEGENEPRKGFWFRTSEGWRDEDGDTFYEGKTKVLIGKPTLACHNEDYPCLIDEDGWTKVECEGYRCGSCGSEYTWDNDHCSDHSYSYSNSEKIAQLCEQSARDCCTDKTNPEAPAVPEDVGILASPRSAPERKVVQVEF